MYSKVVDFSKSIIGLSCTRRLIIQGKWGDKECLKVALDKFLSLGIVVGSSLVKLPQIAKIVLAGDAQGVSLAAHFLDLIAASINFSYNLKAGNSFLGFGETLMISIQNAIIVALIGLYGNELLFTILISVVYSASMAALFSPGLLGVKEMGYLQMASIPVAALSRFPQLYQLIYHKNIGQLSQLTAFLMTLGSMVRVFTTWKEGGKDEILLVGAIVCATLNLVITVMVVLISKGVIKPKLGGKNLRTRQKRVKKD